MRERDFAFSVHEFPNVALLFALISNLAVTPLSNINIVKLDIDMRSVQGIFPLDSSCNQLTSDQSQTDKFFISFNA